MARDPVTRNLARRLQKSSSYDNPKRNDVAQALGTIGALSLGGLGAYHGFRIGTDPPIAKVLTAGMLGSAGLVSGGLVGTGIGKVIDSLVDRIAEARKRRAQQVKTAGLRSWLEDHVFFRKPLLKDLKFNFDFTPKTHEVVGPLLAVGAGAGLGALGARLYHKHKEQKG